MSEAINANLTHTHSCTLIEGWGWGRECRMNHYKITLKANKLVKVCSPKPNELSSPLTAHNHME